jgi:predicted chitinase
MSVKALQTKIGATPDGMFGPATMKAAMVFYKLSAVRAAHFFGQTSHETGEFKTFSENLNYSAEGLKKIFKKYFNDLTALACARNPEKLLIKYMVIEWGMETKPLEMVGNLEVVELCN